MKHTVFWLDKSEGLGYRGFKTLEFHCKSVHGKDSLSPYLWIKTGTEQKYADVGLSYGCLFLILSSYVYELNSAHVHSVRNIWVHYDQNGIFGILFMVGCIYFKC